MTNDNRSPDAFSVLLIDDDPNFRALMKVLIESTGCEVLEARSGKDADTLLKDNHPNLVIVDYRLPGVDGMQWIEKFREAGWTSPIIFLSGSWCDLQSFTKLRSLLKVNLILQKPIVPELFLDQIESLLPRRKEYHREDLSEQSFQPTSSGGHKFDTTGSSAEASFENENMSPTSAFGESDSIASDHSSDFATTQSAQSAQSPPSAPLVNQQSANQPSTGQQSASQSNLSQAVSLTEASGPGSSQHQENVTYSAGSTTGGRESLQSQNIQLRSGGGGGDSILRSLFEGEATDEGLTNSTTPPPKNVARAKEIMRKSTTRLEIFKPTETTTTTSSVHEKFGAVSLSKDDPDEMAIIESEEPDVLEQLARFSQKASVEMALRNARADYARLLPEKTEELSRILVKLKQDTSNATLFEEAVQIAHQLKGTAGSLGFPHLGRISAIIENMLLDGGMGDTSSNGQKWARLERQVSQCVSIAKANAIAYSRPEGFTRPAFMKRVALVGGSPLFATLTHDLAREAIAEAYLVDSVESLLKDESGEPFNCVLVDSAALEEQSPTELLEQARDSKRLRNAPFAFIAADSWHADEALWLYTGAEFLLPKTVTSPALLSVVESMLVLNDADRPRVLTVDDDAVLTGFICDTLATNGIATDSLNEPIDVLASLEHFRPDLLLLDVVMPGVSGYDVCRMLRADEKYAELPILFLTSKSSPEGRAAAFRAGADDFLSKPILTEELIARVRSRLELSKPFKDRAGTNNQTGLTTRQAFLDSLNRSLTHSSLAGNVFSVVIVAIEKFQELALSFGFKKQEAMFKDLAQLLQARFRVEDLKGHWSEGSFALAFPNVEADVIRNAMNFLAGEFAVGTTHNTSGVETTSHRLIRYGLSELIIDGVNGDTLLAHAYERCLRSAPIDVSSFVELCQDE